MINQFAFYFRRAQHRIGFSTEPISQQKLRVLDPLAHHFFRGRGGNGPLMELLSLGKSIARRETPALEIHTRRRRRITDDTPPPRACVAWTIPRGKGQAGATRHSDPSGLSRDIQIVGARDKSKPLGRGQRLKLNKISRRQNPLRRPFRRDDSQCVLNDRITHPMNAPRFL